MVGGGGGEVAQLVKRRTEQSGAIVTRVQVPGAVRDLLPESTPSADSLTGSVQPREQIAFINVSAHFKNPKLGQSAHRKCYTHR